MNKNESFPQSEGQPDLEELKAGKYSISPAEEEKVRAEAKAAGKDPEAAVEALKKRMEKATARLREDQAEKGIEDLEKGHNQG